MSDPSFHGVFSSLLKKKGFAFGGPAEVMVAPEDESAEEEKSEVEETPAVESNQIAVDIFEEGSYTIIKAMLAGVKLADIDIDVTDNKLAIRCRRIQADDLSESKMLVEENYYGDLEREIEMPFAINSGKVRATFSKDCILKVFVPREERKIKVIKVNEGG